MSAGLNTHAPRFLMGRRTDRRKRIRRDLPLPLPDRFRHSRSEFFRHIDYGAHKSEELRRILRQLAGGFNFHISRGPRLTANRLIISIGRNRRTAAAAKTFGSFARCEFSFHAICGLVVSIAAIFAAPSSINAPAVPNAATGETDVHSVPTRALAIKSPIPLTAPRVP